MMTLGHESVMLSDTCYDHMVLSALLVCLVVRGVLWAPGDLDITCCILQTGQQKVVRALAAARLGSAFQIGQAIGSHTQGQDAYPQGRVRCQCACVAIVSV